MMDEYAVSRRGALSSTPLLLLLSGCLSSQSPKILLKKIEIRNLQGRPQKFFVEVYNKDKKLVSEKVSLPEADQDGAAVASISGEWGQTARAYKITVSTSKNSKTITASYLIGILDEDSYSGPPCLDLTFDAERDGDLGVAFGGESNCKGSTGGQ